MDDMCNELLLRLFCLGNKVKNKVLDAQSQIINLNQEMATNRIFTLSNNKTQFSQPESGNDNEPYFYPLLGVASFAIAVRLRCKMLYINDIFRSLFP